MDILRNFDVILKNRRVSTDEVARSLNITPQSLRTSLRGNPTIARLEAVADALECPVSDLLDLKDDGIFGMVKINGRIFTIQSRQELKGFVTYCRRRMEFWNDEVLPPLKSFAIDSAPALNIINSELLNPDELEIISKALDFRFMDGFYFSSLGDRLTIEISSERMTEKEYLDMAALREGLDRASTARCRIEDEYNRLEQSGADKQVLAAARKKMSSIIDVQGAYEWRLRQFKGDAICLEHEIPGLFFSSSNPKIVLYLGSIRETEISPVAVLIHELFHALFYFASNQLTLAREIEEPMAEFATLQFLSTASDSLTEFKDIAEDYASYVYRKKYSIGRDCPYGFGYFLFENIASLSSFDQTHWLNRFIMLSNQIVPGDNTVQSIHDRLRPPYPFLEEEDIFYDFEKLIFGTNSKKKTQEKVLKPAAKEAPALKPRDAVLESIKKIGKPYVTYEEIENNIGKIDPSAIPPRRSRLTLDDSENPNVDDLSDEELKQGTDWIAVNTYSLRFGWNKEITFGILALEREGILQQETTPHGVPFFHVTI